MSFQDTMRYLKLRTLGRYQLYLSDDESDVEVDENEEEEEEEDDDGDENEAESESEAEVPDGLITKPRSAFEERNTQLRQSIEKLQDNFYLYFQQGERILYDLLATCQQLQELHGLQHKLVFLYESDEKLNTVHDIGHSCLSVLRQLLQVQRSTTIHNFACYRSLFTSDGSHGGSAMFCTEATKLCMN
jgi:hypothetical protein